MLVRCRFVSPRLALSSPPRGFHDHVMMKKGWLVATLRGQSLPFLEDCLHWAILLFTLYRRIGAFLLKSLGERDLAMHEFKKWSRLELRLRGFVHCWCNGVELEVAVGLGNHPSVPQGHTRTNERRAR